MIGQSAKCHKLWESAKWHRLWHVEKRFARFEAITGANTLLSATMAPVYTREDAKRFYYQLVLRIFKVCGTCCFFGKTPLFLNPAFR